MNMLFTFVGETYSCNTLFGCMGYYSYENPNRPKFPGEERFKGRIVHPQFWDKECDEQIKDAKVALVGSGATSVTLLPNITDTVEKVTMIQRTPTYIAALPGVYNLDIHARSIMTLLLSSSDGSDSRISEDNFSNGLGCLAQ